MKIGLIVPGFSASEADWCIPVLLNYVRELAKVHDVHLFALRYPHQQRTYSVHGATVHALGGVDVSGLNRVPLMLRALAAISSAQKQQRFDLMHGLWADEPGFLAVVAGRVWGIPAVVSVMGGELVGLPDIGYGGQLSHINRWLTHIALRGAQRVTAGSSYLLRLVSPFVNAKRLQRMPLGVDTTMFGPNSTRSTPLLSGNIKLLHVASLIPVKDQRTLLRALVPVVKQLQDVHLHVVGDGPLRPDLEREANTLGLASHVTFHGALSHEQLPAYYCAADLCLLSSRFESQGMAILEAAACGRATVGTDVGLLPDLGSAAITAPTSDAYALGQAILSVAQDSRRRIEMGARARAFVESGYTLAQAIEALSLLYADLYAEVS